MKKQAKIPIILYESEEQALPYIEVQEDEEMPQALFIQEYKHTGEFEPGDDGEPAPIVDMHIRMYANMNTLKDSLSPELYDEVRVCLGLMPVKQARAEGMKIMDKVGDNIAKQKSEKETTKSKVKEEFTKKLNQKLTEKFYKTNTVKNSKKKNRKKRNKK